MNSQLQNKLFLVRLFSFFALLTILSVNAAEWYVNNETGNDLFSGANAQVNDNNGPFKTIQLAIDKAVPGETINLANTGFPYRQTVVIRKGGIKGKPITLDGHGAMLSGADPCPAQGWKEEKDGIYFRNDIGSNVFMVIDGQMVFWSMARDALVPGEFCYEKGLLYYYPPSSEELSSNAITVTTSDGAITLQTNNWQHCHSTIRKVRRYCGLKKPTAITVNGKAAPLVTARQKLRPGQWCTDNTGTVKYPPASILYYYPQAGKDIENQTIECVTRDNGVGLYGKHEYVIIRNINVKHVGNDGFNIHGEVTKAEFYNCNAHDCGDEGFSSHDKCGTLLDGAIYVNCDNGIANVNNSGYSITRNVILMNSRHVGFQIQKGSEGQVHHELSNAILVNNPLQLNLAQITADNILIVKTTAMKGFSRAITVGSSSVLSKLTVIGTDEILRICTDSHIQLSNVIFGSNQKGIHARTATPADLVVMKKVLLGSGLEMEWGVKQPWQIMPLQKWCSSVGVPEVSVLTKNALARPEKTITTEIEQGHGCNTSLIHRYNEYIAH